MPLAAWSGWGGSSHGTHNSSLEGQLGLYDLSPEATVRVTPVVTTGRRASGFVAEFVGGAWIVASDPTYNAQIGHTQDGVSAVNEHK